MFRPGLRRRSGSSENRSVSPRWRSSKSRWSISTWRGVAASQVGAQLLPLCPTLPIHGIEASARGRGNVFFLNGRQVCVCGWGGRPSSRAPEWLDTMPTLQPLPLSRGPNIRRRVVRSGCVGDIQSDGIVIVAMRSATFPRVMAEDSHGLGPSRTLRAIAQLSGKVACTKCCAHGSLGSASPCCEQLRGSILEAVGDVWYLLYSAGAIAGTKTTKT